jgi:hypothetical protein
VTTAEDRRSQSRRAASHDRNVNRFRVCRHHSRFRPVRLG